MASLVEVVGMIARLITHLIVAVAAAMAAWVFQDARMDAAVAEVRLEMSEAGIKTAGEKLQAARQTLTEERAINKTYQEALNAARTREHLLRTEIDSLHRLSDGLRQQSADAAHKLAAAPPAAVLEYALAVNAVFDDCRSAYAGVVEKADGHASDVRTLVQAWPGVNP